MADFAAFAGRRGRHFSDLLRASGNDADAVCKLITNFLYIPLRGNDDKSFNCKKREIYEITEMASKNLWVVSDQGPGHGCLHLACDRLNSIVLSKMQAVPS